MGTRYLFMSSKYCIGVFEVKMDEIYFLGTNPSYSPFENFQANNRSEMEVYEYATNNESSSFTLATSYFSRPDLSISNNNVGGALHFFDVTISQGNVNFNRDYQVVIPKNLELKRYDQSVNGIEFSRDGKTIYASVAYISHSYPRTYAYDNNLIYCNRQTLGDKFTYVNSILNGKPTQDFGLGQIERGLDNKLYIAGNGRIGTLDNANDPTSLFTPNALSVANRLTEGTEYHNSTSLAPLMQLYLLPDQIDGEDYTQRRFTPNNFLSVIENCEYPYLFNLLGFFYTSINNNLGHIVPSIIYTNSLNLSSNTSVSLSLSPDMSCPEVVEIRCCDRDVDKILCSPVFTSTLVDENNNYKICASTCTNDIPAPCAFVWSFDYIDQNGNTATFYSKNSTFCTTVPKNSFNQSGIVLHLKKTLCAPLSCGGNTVVEMEKHLSCKH